MGLIGNIAISMTTDTKAFTAGLNKATAELRAFGSIGNQLAKNSPLTSIGTGFYSIGKGAKQAFDESAKFAGLMGLAAQGGLTLVKDLGKDASAAFNGAAKGLGRMGQGVAMIAGGVGKAGFQAAALGARALTAAISSTVAVSREAINHLGMLSAVAGGIAAYGFAKLVQGGMALGEQTDRARITFGQFATEVISAADEMAKAYGVSKRSFIQSASALGQIFQGAGYGEQAAAGLSVHFVKLATDLSSFAHIPMEEAMQKIQSGLVGMARPLREVGVLMSEEAVNAYAAKHGIAALGTELNESQKVQARVGLITESLAKAQGNLSLTSDSAANQVRALEGRFENLKDSIGTALIGIVIGPLADLQTGLTAIQMAWDNSAIAAANASVGVVGGAQQQVASIGWVQRSVGFLADAWDVLRLGFSAVQSYITAGIGKIVEGLLYLSKSFDSMAAKVGLGGTGATQFLETYAKDLKNLSEVQWEGFQKKLTEPWPSEGINTFFDAARQKTALLRADLGKTKTDISQFHPAAGLEKTAKVKDMKFADASEYGSDKAVNTILRSRYGGGHTNKENAKIAENTGKAANLLEKIAANTSSSAAINIASFV